MENIPTGPPRHSSADAVYAVYTVAPLRGIPTGPPRHSSANALYALYTVAPPQGDTDSAASVNGKVGL